MIPDQPQPFLKLCQLLNQDTPDAEGHPTRVMYQEDCDGKILVARQTYPLVLQCEVINFVSEDAFKQRGQVVSFASVSVTLEVSPPETSIREAVYQQLLAYYPTLVI